MAVHNLKESANFGAWLQCWAAGNVIDFVCISRVRRAWRAYLEDAYAQPEGSWFHRYQERANGPIRYVLIFNPYFVVREHYEAGHGDETLFNSPAQRMIEIGAHDLGAPPDEEVMKPREAVRRRRHRARKETA